MDVVSSISAAIDIVKKLRDLSKKIGEADFRMLLAELTDQLGDAKLQAANLKIELAQATESIAALKREAARTAASEPDVHEGSYVFGDQSRHYCTACFDTGSRKILLTDLSGPFRAFGKRQCPVCEKTYGQ